MVGAVSDGSVSQSVLSDGVRLTLYALGSVEGGRISRPADPVAAWLLRRFPDLAPGMPLSEALTTVRARASLVDRMIAGECARARQEGCGLCYGSVGGGLDARWYRLLPAFSDVVREQREIEEPALLLVKDEMLADSPFEVPWSQVIRRPLPMERWTVQACDDARWLVVLEGVHARMADTELQTVLTRIRADASDAVVVLEAPVSSAVSWSKAAWAALGWSLVEDVRLAPRRSLVTADGRLVCPGIRALRVQRLVGRR